MGTRADFYIGIGKDAEWIGSIAFNGHPGGNPKCILGCKNEKEYRAAVESLLKSKESATTPDMGWPWPWNDSSTTNYAYMFVNNKVWTSKFGDKLFDPLKEFGPPNGVYPEKEMPEFPDMQDRKKVTFGKRSGLVSRF